MARVCVVQRTRRARVAHVKGMRRAVRTTGHANRFPSARMARVCVVQRTRRARVAHVAGGLRGSYGSLRTGCCD
jgi:hypothetical protein